MVERKNNIFDYKLSSDELKPQVTRSRTIDTHIFINTVLMDKINFIKAVGNKECNIRYNKSKLINMALLRLFNELELLPLNDALIFLKDLESDYNNFRSLN